MNVRNKLTLFTRHNIYYFPSVVLPGDVDHIMSGHDLPAIDLASWMGQLSPQLRSIPIIFLAIPGSHDSLMYKVMRRSPVAPDAPQHLHLWNVLVPGIVRRWVQTQELEAGAQLELGVRYFDIRASYLGGNFMICHGLYSGDSLQPLHEINLFLDQHPTEVVILDFQHVYNATAEQHQSYCDTIAAIFGNKILPRLGNSLTKCSLDDMTASGKQVIVIYRYLCDRDALFWGGQDWPTPWPNTVKVKTLQQFLADSIQERDKEKGYVSQCILTPSGRFIVRKCVSQITTLTH